MAQQEIEHALGFVDNRYTTNPGQPAGWDGSTQLGLNSGAPITAAKLAPYLFIGSVSANTGLKGALNTYDPAFYTLARLNTMSKNDMLYAYRLTNGVDAGGI